MSTRVVPLDQNTSHRDVLTADNEEYSDPTFSAWVDTTTLVESPVTRGTGQMWPKVTRVTFQTLSAWAWAANAAAPEAGTRVPAQTYSAYLAVGSRPFDPPSARVEGQTEGPQ